MTKNEKTQSEATESTPVDTAPVLALVESAVNAWNDALTNTARSIESAAVAAYAAAPHIGDGQVWQDGAAYRSQFPAPRPDKSGNTVSVSASTLTLWTLLGKAHSLGLTPDADATTWRRMVQRATDKRISSVIRDEKATGPKIKRAVAACFPKGQYAAAEKADTPTEGEQHGNTGSNSEDQTVPSSVPALLDLLDVIAARLCSEPVTPAEHKRIAEAVESLSGIAATPATEVEAARKAA